MPLCVRLSWQIFSLNTFNVSPEHQINSIKSNGKHKLLYSANSTICHELDGEHQVPYSSLNKKGIITCGLTALRNAPNLAMSCRSSSIVTTRHKDLSRPSRANNRQVRERQPRWVKVRKDMMWRRTSAGSRKSGAACRSSSSTVKMSRLLPFLAGNIFGNGNTHRG